jgi:hypothetical protein
MKKINKNKKAISAVVATVLIILITVAAVTIIWAAVVPLINDKLKSGTVCLDAVSQIQLLDEGYTCKASDGHNISIQVKHLNKMFDLTDIQVLVSAGGDTTVFRVENDTTTLVPTGTNIPLPSANEEKVYVIDTHLIVGDISEVQIAPIVGVGGAEQFCDISSVKVLKNC